MGSSFALEHARVLPKGLRNIDIKNASASVSQKSDELGTFHPIAEPLAKDFTFKKVIENESGVNKMLLQSFLYGKFLETDSLGTFTADMRGNVSVTAGIFSYGVTDSLTLALAIPYYQAKVRVSLGFQASENAQKLIDLLNDPANNQAAKSKELALKLENAVGELNNKLVLNGYTPIQDWQKSGIGDITLAAKYQFINGSFIRLANASGLTAPTGYSGDANVLVNIPFGTGSWGIFDTIYIDEVLSPDFWFNQYVKYTYQAPARKNFRLKTEDEAIVVPEERIRFKLGDRWETGVSAQYENYYGVILGTGLSYTRKQSDRYETDNREAKQALEKNTYDSSTYWETKIGYQSIPAFLRKEIPVPFNVTLEFKKHLQSINTVVKDLYTFDLNLYF